MVLQILDEVVAVAREVPLVMDEVVSSSYPMLLTGLTEYLPALQVEQ